MHATISPSPARPSQATPLESLIRFTLARAGIATLRIERGPRTVLVLLATPGQACDAWDALVAGTRLELAGDGATGVRVGERGAMVLDGGEE